MSDNTFPFIDLNRANRIIVLLLVGSALVIAGGVGSYLWKAFAVDGMDFGLQIAFLASCIFGACYLASYILARRW